MPFLTRKTGNAERDALLQSTLGASTELPWREDHYLPSKSKDGLEGLDLPAFVAGSQQKRQCSHVMCANGWTRPWRSRRRPIFEGQWGCSGRCMLAMVQASVRRELGIGAVPSSVPHRHRVPLGLVMLAQGWISHPQLQRALAAQREYGTGRIGDWLIRECGVEPEQVVRGLSLQWGCPVLTTEGFSPEAMSLVMPKVFIEQFSMLPLRVAGGRFLYLAFADQLDASATLVVEKMTGLNVVSGVVEGSQFEAARKRLLACEGVETKVEAAEGNDVLAARITAILEQKQPVASRLVRLHQKYWLRLWLESGALGQAGSLSATGEDVMDYVFSVAAS